MNIEQKQSRMPLDGLADWLRDRCVDVFMTHQSGEANEIARQLNLWADEVESIQSAISKVSYEERQAVGVGYISANGQWHKGCPGINEPDGWVPLLIEE